MKKILILVFLLSAQYHLRAQLVKETTYNFSVGTTKINATDWKYFLMDVPLSQCRLYNPDHSLYKTISCPVPVNNYLYDVKFVSENFFNTDSKLELFYSYYEWISTGGINGTGYYKYGAKVINESGTVLQDITGGLYAYVFKVADADSRFFVYCYDNSVTPYKIWTNVYKVGGDASAIDNFQVNQLKSALDESTVYPNPADNTVTIPYTLPDNISLAMINIYNIQGIVIRSFQVDKTFKDLFVDVSGFVPGTYFYAIEYDGQFLKTDTFEVY